MLNGALKLFRKQIHLSTLICHVQTFYHQFHVKKGLVTLKIKGIPSEPTLELRCCVVPNNFLIKSPLFKLIVSFAILFGTSYKKNSEKHRFINCL